MNKLKPCPFCGDKKAPNVMPDEEIDGSDNGQFVVCCSMCFGGCGATSGYCDTEEEAIEAWNRRTPNESCE